MKIEIRSASSATIEGYVNAVGRDSRVLPKKLSPRATSDFVEMVTPKTFEKALSKTDNVEVRFNHGVVLGSTKDKTLELYEDSIGLYAKATITDPATIDKAKRKELRGWSFGFVANADKWDEVSEGLQRRSLEDIELREVTILDKTPAYIATSIEMRGEDCFIAEERGFETEFEVVDNTPKDKIDNSKKHREVEILKLKGRY